MNSLSQPRQTALRIWAIGAIITAAIVLAYSNLYRAPFVFDDIRGIVRNPTLAHLTTALHPPENHALSGRPIANLSFAVNRMISGDNVWSYHAMNVAIHAAAALLLFGIVRRTFVRIWGYASAGRSAVLAGVAALLWSVHPLQTEAVSFLIQRVESLMGLFYLSTLYAFIRATNARRPIGWYCVSVAACALGMATKEVMVSAPLLVALYDRTFSTKTWSDTLKTRSAYYLCLAATWIILALCVAGGHGRISAAGPLPGLSPWQYLVTQGYAIPHYLRLAVWPANQVFDYGYRPVALTPAIAFNLVLLFVGFSATLVTLVRPPRSEARRLAAYLGFVGLWFFAILAPSSSVVPLTLQSIAEHRVYLALAAPIAAVIAGLHGLRRRHIAVLGGCIAAAFGALTFSRNTVYETPTRLWLDTVTKRPDNARAWANLAHQLADTGRWRDAIAACGKQLQADPRYNLDADAVIGRALLELGDARQALPHLESARRQSPEAFDVQSNLGMALAAVGRTSDAITAYEESLRLNPASSDAHGNLANALVTLRHFDAAWPHYAAAAKAKPADPQVQLNWAASLAEAGQMDEALAHFRRAAALDPTSATPYVGLGDVAARQGHASEAIAHYETALRLDPNLTAAHNNLAVVLAQSGRMADAIAQFQHALRLAPNSAPLHYELAMAYATVGRRPDARKEAEAALRLDPNLTEARQLLSSLDE